jgi:phosphopantetheinyl transferase
MRVYLVKANSDTRKMSKDLFPLVFNLETGDQVNYGKLARSANGKPLPINNVYFNISHSGAYWCVAFSDSECGIDIEINRQLRAQLSKRILFQSENLIDNNLLKNWVIKEAYAKMKSVGIGLNFSTVSLEQIESECVVTDLSDDDYILYAVGSSAVTDVTKLSWDGKHLA